MDLRNDSTFTLDKAEWGDGPWQDEPDTLVWRDEATGLPCLIRRGSFGQLNGYVGIRPGHPLFGVDMGNMPEVVEEAAHGGVTFADRLSEDSATWHIGFDCGHYRDRSLGLEAWERSVGFAPVSGPFRIAYRDIAYVRGVVTELAAALASLSSVHTEDGTLTGKGEGG